MPTQQKDGYMSMGVGAKKYGMSLADFKKICKIQGVKTHKFRDGYNNRLIMYVEIAEAENKLSFNTIEMLGIDADEEEMFEGNPQVLRFYNSIKDNPSKEDVKKLAELIKYYHKNYVESLYISYPVPLCELIYSFGFIKRCKLELEPMDMKTHIVQQHGVHHSASPSFFDSDALSGKMNKY